MNTALCSSSWYSASRFSTTPAVSCTDSKLLQEARLADPRRSAHEAEPALAALRFCELAEQQVELAVAPDERGQAGLHPCFEARAHSRARVDPIGEERTALALQLQLHAGFGLEKRFSAAERVSTHDDLIATRGPGQPRGGIDRVARDLVLPVERVTRAGEDQTRVHPRVHPHFERSTSGDLEHQLVHRFVKLQRGFDRTPRVILRGHRQAEYR